MIAACRPYLSFPKISSDGGIGVDKIGGPCVPFCTLFGSSFSTFQAALAAASREPGRSGHSRGLVQSAWEYISSSSITRARRPVRSAAIRVRNHLPQIAAMDLFVVPTLGFNLLYVLVIVRLARRELTWINATKHPTADWIAQQITEAFPWGDDVPRYLIRDRDAVYGTAVIRRLRAMGIRDKPIAPGSPWQNCFAERMIGTIRRECVDHVIALGERHLRRVLEIVRRLLQFGENASIIEHGCTHPAAGSTDGTYCVVRHGRWPAPPIRSNLAFRHAQDRTTANLRLPGRANSRRGSATAIP
jgi:hypothetical protein